MVRPNQHTHNSLGVTAMIDLTTNRALHVARRLTVHVRAIGVATWYAEDGDRYATTNVAPIWPTVTHFRAPLSGGKVEVMALDGSYSPTGLDVTTFTYRGTDGLHTYTANAIVTDER